MRILKLIFFWGVAVNAFCQHTVQMEQLLQKAESWCYIDLTETEIYIDSAFQLVLEQKDTAAHIRGLIVKGICSTFHNPSEKSLKALLRAKELVEIDWGTATDTLLIQINNGIGNYYYQIEELDSAFLVFDMEINRLRQQPELSTEEFNYLIPAYLFAGAIKREQKAYNEAIDYFNYAITIEKEQAQKENRTPDYVSTLGRLGMIYNLQGNYRKAIPNLKVIIMDYEAFVTKFPEKKKRFGQYIVSYQQGISESYINLNKLDSAFFYLERTFDYPVPNLSFRAKSNTLLGRAYDLDNDHIKAKQAYSKAIKAIEEQYTDQKHTSVAETYMEAGNYYSKNQDYQKALSFYQKSIINLVADFEEKDIFVNPDLENILSAGDLINVIHKKVNTLYDYSKSNGDKAHVLAAWKTGQVALDLLEQIKKEEFVFEQDLMELVNSHYSLYETLLEIGYELDYHEELFLLAEKSKTASLLKNLSSSQSNLYAAIPSQLIKEERVLIRVINRLKEKIYQFRPTNFQDSLKLIQLKNRLFEKEERRKQLRGSYQNEESYQLFSPTYMGVFDLQKQVLRKDQAIIEYFVGEQNIYAFLIKQDTFFVHRIEHRKKIASYAATLKEDIFYKKDQLFAEKAHGLYQSIFAPLEVYGLPPNLFIIPDGILHYVPFDVLLEEIPQANEKYTSYPYLIKKYTFSYCLSSNLLQSLQTKQHANTPISQVLSFAPAFHAREAIANPLLISRDQLNHLAFAYPEIQTISNVVNSQIVSGKEASKNVFLAMASNYQFIHLATHGKVDDANASFSFVAFSNLVDTLQESYKLFTNELNTLSLNADMVVLSACETGIGKAYKGEGLISLSRGFLAAGAKSVVTTLWNINDQLTNKIVISFYENLKTGMGKAEALRQAKLNYLSESDQFEAHPKYWAAFTPVGDMSALDEQVFVNGTNKKFYWLLGLMGMLCILTLFIRRINDYQSIE